MRSWRTIIPIFLLLALFLMPVTAKTSTASSVWQFSPSMSEHRYGAAVTSSVYGGVFVAGGQIAGTYLSSAEVYVPSTGAWHDIAPMNTPRFQAAATAAGGKIYVLGGYNSTGWLDTVEVYTPATDTWAYITPDMPTARSALAAVTGVDGNIYAIGGYNAGGSLKTVEKYSPATDTWSVVAPLQTARRGLAAVTALNGNIYAIGGTAGVIATASVEAYSIVALHWHYVAALRTPRVDLAADVGSDGLIYAVGGRSSTASSTGLASVEAYATTANTWNFTPSMNLGRYALGAALASDGLIYAVGGASGTVALRSVERYPVAPPATVPGTPSNLQVIPGIGTATVSWTAPYNGGSVITSYVVSAYLGNSNSVAARVTVNGSTTSATLSGLPNGFTYTFGVQAVNAVGAGVEARSGGYTLATIPTAPFNVTALGGIGTLTVSWSTPTSNGGSPLTAYIVTASTGNPAETKVVTVSPAANSVVIGQLIHGRTYTATVAAVNAVGTGPASSPSLPTTLPTVPGPVTNLVVSHGDVSVTAVWQTPTFNGGMPVSSYYVTLSDGVHAAITQVVTGTSATFTNLATGYNYTITIMASNAVGTGAGVSQIAFLPNVVPNLIVPAAVTVDHGDALTFTVTATDPELSEHLTLAASGLPSGSTFADLGNGNGKVTGVAAVPAGTYTPTITVTDSHNAIVSKTVSITVDKEETVIGMGLTNPTLVRVAKPTDKAKSVTLRATIREVTDPNGYADIAEAAPVTYTLKNLVTGKTLTARASHSGGGIEGTVTAKHTFGNLPVGVYRVKIDVGGNFYQGAGETMFTIASKSAVGSAKGTGTLEFGAAVKVNVKLATNAKAQGTLKFSELVANQPYVVQATAINGVVVTGNKAFVQGKASLNGVTGYRFVATINGNHKTGGDRFGLWLVDPNHTTVSSLSYNPTALMTGKMTVSSSK